MSQQAGPLRRGDVAARNSIQHQEDTDPPDQSQRGRRIGEKGTRQRTPVQAVRSEAQTLGAAALEYLERGWSIIPTKGKKPAISKWKPYQSRLPAERRVKEWFNGKRPVSGLAVVLGSVSGDLVCRDFDKEGAYEAWDSEHPDVARTLPTVQTKRGHHVYFRANVRQISKFDDGELRGAGYCLLPPSRHPNGPIYEWVIPLPEEDLPFIDPYEVGLAPRETEKQRNREIEESKKPSNVGGGKTSPCNKNSTSTEEALERAIMETLPASEGQRNRAIFEFARYLKAIPALADADLDSLRPIVKSWHERALAVIGTKPFDDTWADFTYAWPRVRFAGGTRPMDLILEEARNGEMPRVTEQYDSPKTRLLIAVCASLQRRSGDGPFFLSCRTAAKIAELDLTTAFRRLRMLESDGVLEAVKRGTRLKATRYLYLGDRVRPDGVDSSKT